MRDFSLFMRSSTVIAARKSESDAVFSLHTKILCKETLAIPCAWLRSQGIHRTYWLLLTNLPSFFFTYS